AQMTGALGQDGYSLNLAARTLTGIVEDATRFAALEGAVFGMPAWKDEARTAIALELAAAKLLAHCAAPVMPRFAGKLAAALGIDPPTQWPELVTLVPPGSKVSLARQRFFGGGADQPAGGPQLPWLCGVVREALQLPEDADVAGATLVSLGVESMQAIALQ